MQFSNWADILTSVEISGSLAKAWSSASRGIKTATAWIHARHFHLSPLGFQFFRFQTPLPDHSSLCSINHSSELWYGSKLDPWSRKLNTECQLQISCLNRRCLSNDSETWEGLASSPPLRMGNKRHLAKNRRKYSTEGHGDENSSHQARRRC